MRGDLNLTLSMCRRCRHYRLVCYSRFYSIFSLHAVSVIHSGNIVRRSYLWSPWCWIQACPASGAGQSRCCGTDSSRTHRTVRRHSICSASSTTVHRACVARPTTWSSFGRTRFHT